MTVVLSIIVVLLCVPQEQGELLLFQVLSDESTKTVSLWNNQSGQHYVFLPSYAKLDQVKMVLLTRSPVSIDGVQIKNDMTCASFEEGIPYPFCYTAWGKDKQGEIIFLRSANVAAMFIDIQSGSMDYIHEEKGNKESGKMMLCLPDGTVEFSGDIAAIQGRGNTTWMGYEKKPYSLELSEEANLLNLGSAQKWILLANANDPTHMRNKVVYDFADRIALQYSPDSDWVDLYLNGEYAGLYLLCERNEVYTERVNIAQNGSFLVSMEIRERLTAQNYSYISTAADQALRVHYPENPSASQLQAMESTWQSIENAILAEDGVDPVTGKNWMEQIDLDSWVKKYLIEEIFANDDACYISQFFYCDGTDDSKKTYAGPVWDYDLTMGAGLDKQLHVPNSLYANRREVNDKYDVVWFHALYQKEPFYERMVEIYRNDFLPLFDGFFYEYIEECSNHIKKAVSMNRVRWQLEQVYICEITRNLQNFMKQRISFLNSIWLEERPYCIVKVDNAKGSNYGYYAVFYGEKLTDLPVLESTKTEKFLGWYDADSGEPFCFSDPIYEDIMICARWQYVPSLGDYVRQMILIVFLLLFLAVADEDWQRRR